VKVMLKIVLKKFNHFNFEDVILALGNVSTQTIENHIIYFLNKGKTVQILPDELDILSGKFKTQSIFGSPLIEIPTDLMTPWEKITKRLADILLSIFRTFTAFTDFTGGSIESETLFQRKHIFPAGQSWTERQLIFHHQISFYD
jgi:hypothetical protein